MNKTSLQLQVFKENKHVIFTGNGYSAEWPVEAEKRGLPNLNTTPKAIATWTSVKNKMLGLLGLVGSGDSKGNPWLKYVEIC